MDLDDLDPPIKVPSRTQRFAPRSSKLKPKTEPAPSAPKPEPSLKREPQESVSAPKAEPQKFDDLVQKKKEDEGDIEASHNAEPKSEQLVANGAVKMEIDARADAEEKSREDDRIDEDHEEEEDMVVREIDVYFTASIDANTQLYVMQYPLRPRWRPYELDERCEEVRVKPGSRDVEVDLSIDFSSQNYDNNAAGKQMTKQTLSSSWSPPLATGYAVGVLISNKLHLNPIHSVVQLRPSMEHLKSGGSKRKTNVAGNAVDTVKLEDSNEQKSTGLPKKPSKQMGFSTERKSEDEEV